MKQGAKRFRYDPYKASVLTASFTPEKMMSPIRSFPSAVAIAATAAVSYRFAPYPVAPLMAPYPYAGLSVPSCDITPVPTAVPTRVTSPAPVPNIAAEAPTRSSSVSSIEGTAVEMLDANVKHYAVIKFKHDTYPYEAPFRVAVGDYVIVEGDRGENIGLVKSVTTEKPTRPVASKILRKATMKDRDASTQLRRKEQTATKFCENAVKEVGINMSIVDTEYQLDQNKLSVYYKSKGMVDFRRVQRTLFREFRCRVWFVNWNELVMDE